MWLQLKQGYHFIQVLELPLELQRLIFNNTLDIEPHKHCSSVYKSEHILWILVVAHIKWHYISIHPKKDRSEMTRIVPVNTNIDMESSKAAA